jgi:hypothetical protein
MLAKKIQKEIETLPDEALQKVEDFIRSLKTKKGLKTVYKEKPYNVFDLIANSAIETGIKDLARNHDHYIYRTEKL